MSVRTTNASISTPTHTAKANDQKGAIGTIASVAKDAASASAAIEIARPARGTAARIAAPISRPSDSCQIRPTMNRL